MNKITHDGTELVLLKSQLHEMELKIEHFKLLIKGIEHSEGKTSDGLAERSIFRGYKEEWSWIRKVRFILRRVDLPLTSKELVEYMTTIQDNNIMIKRNPYKSLASSLHREAKNKRVLVHKIMGFRHLLYLLPEWIDENGNADPRYIQKKEIEV